MTPFCYISVLRNRVKVGKLRYLLAKVFLGWDSVPQNWRAIHDGLCISFRMESSRVWQYLLETKTGISGQVWGKDTWSRQWTNSKRQVPVKVSSATYASAKLLSPDTAQSGFFLRADTCHLSGSQSTRVGLQAYAVLSCQGHVVYSSDWYVGTGSQGLCCLP